mgnify:CR=1 FL=1
MDAIRIAFEGDEEIVALYDPNVEVFTVGEVIEDIQRKIFEIKDFCICRGVFSSQTLIGYYVYTSVLLISFGMAKEYRSKENLEKFFSLIKQDIGDMFGCRLWTKNKRGIKWLQKNNMQIIDQYDNITELFYLNNILCQ